MTVHELKRSITRKVTEHTVLAAVSTLDCYGVPHRVTTALHADLHELEQLESSRVVDAAKSLVKVAIAHSISPTETTYADARRARDTLGDLLMDTKEIKG
ncbi:hypothetical protein MHZ92_20000 [Sporosarcina sp. ACRSL]|uniref:hypothetical protein n=1 Tax=Sporosarcina sp. ACRSL TaxID=2918215 RepID=UPI001EF3D727|nr:hypothetical protein [Sporosarcina sp. ACRSL]MCG7346392.1 hypothetical protein [Sporosarcina sp. ACRSL]